MEILREDKQGKAKYYANNENKDFEIVSTKVHVEIAIRGHNICLDKENLNKILEIMLEMKSRIT